MFECERCGSTTRAMGNIKISIPSEFVYNLSKKNIRSKEFRIMGALWETFDFICTNVSCGKVTDGYGNYVTNLQKENERLKLEVEKLSLDKSNIKVLDEEDINDLKPIFQELEKSNDRYEDSLTLKYHLGLDMYGAPPKFVSGDRVIVPCNGLTATVIKQTLRYDGPDFFWGNVELIYDDGVKGVSNSWQIRKINESDG